MLVNHPVRRAKDPTFPDGHLPVGRRRRKAPQFRRAFDQGQSQRYVSAPWRDGGSRMIRLAVVGLAGRLDDI